MALQGTLDTFELPDVLRLLASTKKTGRLHLSSDRGDGDVWLSDGLVVGIDAGGTSDLAEGLFQLLRAQEGSFAFEPGGAPASPSRPTKVEPLLVEAESTLSEWRAIEAVVPSLQAWVCLATELGAPEVTVSADSWRLVAAIGSGMTVGDLAELLGVGEVAVSRLVRDLVELGLGAVAAPPAHAAPAETGIAGAATYEPAPYEPMGAEHSAPLFTPAPEPVAAAVEPADVAPLLAPRPEAFADPVEADEVARQLAMLSPRAAQAVASAAASGSEHERQAALEAVDEGDEPVNRGLLLKFLSSVKT